MQLLSEKLLFLIGVVMRDTHQRLKASRPQRSLCRLEQVHKQGIGQQGNQDGHVITALRGQSARGRIGHITQLV